LKVLGHGFELIAMGGGRFLVQSVPGELSMDDTRILQLAEESNGHVSVELCVDSLRWERERAERVLERLVRLERAWVDAQESNGVQYWFPSLFLEQYNQLNGAGSASGSSSAN
jgi:ESCRT-II complex subunit VPS22